MIRTLLMWSRLSIGKPLSPFAPQKVRHRARATIAVFALAILVLNASFVVLLDERPELRDPEYGLRVSKLKLRLAENPGRPLALVVGSSRAAMGVRPDVWEACRPTRSDAVDPVLFNMSLIGGGPLLELVVLHRLIADGFRPALVLLEFWPLLFCDERDSAGSMAVDRLDSRDRALVRNYSADPAASVCERPHHALNPLYESRQRLLSRLLPQWLPSGNRADWMWKDVDGWGWKPGCAFQPGPSPPQTVLMEQAQRAFSRRLARFQIDDQLDRAFRDAVAFARRHGATVKLLYMPEALAFRGWYPPEVEAAARDYFARVCRELCVTVIDARTWMVDGLFSDGFHLTRIGAAEFTRKLVPAIPAACIPCGQE